MIVAEPILTTASKADIDIIQNALGYEHEGIAAYRLAGASGLLSPGTLSAALVFKEHHEAHRDALARLITDAGGEPVPPKPDSEYVASLNLGALKSEADVVTLAIKLEKGAASGYIGMISSISDPKLAHLFAQISADEMIHWTTLNGAAGQPFPPALQFG